MAQQRRPDGIPSPADKNFMEEPDDGPALSRSATDPRAIAGALPKGEDGRPLAFPSGMAAIDIAETRGLKTVTVCNLSLKTVYLDRLTGPQPVGKKRVIKTPVPPFTTLEMTIEEARRSMAHQERGPAKRKRPSPVLVVVGLFPGDCGGKLRFEAGGRVHKTCPFHACEFGDHAEKPWSVFQAQHFLRMLKTPDAIQRFTSDFDLRTDVTSLALAEVRKRDELHKQERMEASRSVSSSELVV